MNIFELLDEHLLQDMVNQGYIKTQDHPSEPLRILNYTASCQYERVWNEATLQCRGLIFNTETNDVVARPWRKFFNYGEHEADIDPTVPVRVFDKLDGSLGILYPVKDGWAIATRGSFTSEQAIRGTQMLQEKLNWWEPDPELTFLWEVIYPENRVVVDYGRESKLVLLDVLEIETGEQAIDFEWIKIPDPWVGEIDADTLREALTLEPRENAEGIVLRFEDGLMLKLKQEDYVALHRIMTGLSARNVWEYAAVLNCKYLIKEPKHWGSYLGIDPERAAEVMQIKEGWLDNVPDEFHAWVKQVIKDVSHKSMELHIEALAIGASLVDIPDRRDRWEKVKDNPMAKQILQYADGKGPSSSKLKSWRMVEPPPERPFDRNEDVA